MVGSTRVHAPGRRASPPAVIVINLPFLPSSVTGSARGLLPTVARRRDRTIRNRWPRKLEKNPKQHTWRNAYRFVV